MMENVKSISLLLGEAAERAKAPERTAAQSLWKSDFANAPKWFLDKYFRNREGQSCARMCVKAFERVGNNLTDGGKDVLNRWGKPVKLTTGYLAKRVAEDCAKAGFPGVEVHFKGYSLDPERFALADAFSQEEYEENEARHVPGLDGDAAASWNREAPLDRETWEWCAGNMLRALQMRQLMVLSLDEDFSKVMSAPDFVPASFNGELLEIKRRMQETMSVEAALYLMEKEWDDFREFDKDDVVKTYRRCMRCMTGAEAGTPMFDQAYLLGKEPVEGFDWKSFYEMMAKGYVTANPFPDLPEANAYVEVLANEMEVEVLDWEYESSAPENLFDDDSGEAMTNILLAR